MTKNLLSLLVTVTLLAGMFPGMILYGMKPEEAENGCNTGVPETASSEDLNLSFLDPEITCRIGDYLTWRDILNLRLVSRGMHANLSAGIYKPISLGSVNKILSEPYQSSCKT